MNTTDTTTSAVAALTAADTSASISRRRFLNLAAGGTLAGIVAAGGFDLVAQICGADPRAWAAPVGDNDGILILIGMYGGNDSLNTVVPYNDGAYYHQRGSLAIAGHDTLELGGGYGLNRELTELKQWWDNGRLAVIQGIGTPGHTDLSHFNSMANYMSASPGNLPDSGWIGRWLDEHLDGTPDLYAAAEIGTGVPLHLVGRKVRGTGVPATRPGLGNPEDAWLKNLNKTFAAMRTDQHGPWHAAAAAANYDASTLATKLRPKFPASDADLPADALAAKLEIAARLINANLGFRVLTVGWGDFDSHARQPAMHTERMKELNRAVKHFYQTVNQKWVGQVTFATWSEFGRTSWANDGQGTDHGTTNTQFVFGANVRGGLYGQQPRISHLKRWERPEAHVDLRSYYTSLIDGWLGGGARTALGGTFENLGLYAAGPGPTDTRSRIPVIPAARPGDHTDGRSYPPGGFFGINPVRVCDTRDGTGGRTGPLGPGETMNVKIGGVGQIAADAIGVVANVTAVAPSQAHYLTVWPAGAAQPFTSSVNGVPGRAVPNLVIGGIGDDGNISIFNSHGHVDVLVDVFGYIVAGQGDRFFAVTPARVLDTRDGTGARQGALTSGEAVTVRVAGRGGTAGSASAVVMNLTVTEAEASGFLRATPAGVAPAMTSNVNHEPGDTVANSAIVAVGDREITFDGVGAKHVVGDVTGYFAVWQSGQQFTPVVPARVLDTREGLGTSRRHIPAGEVIEVQVAGAGGLPAEVAAVVVNVTATNVDRASFVTVWPEGERPGTSNLNVDGGQTRANLVIVGVGEDGKIRLANPLSGCDLIADISGYFA